MRTRYTVTIVVGVLLAALDHGCSTDSTGVGLAAACTLNSDCAAGLVCSSGLCHSACVTTRDCPAGTLCVKSDEGTICQLSDETGCTYDSDCVGSLVCGNDGKCRNECQRDRDCVAPQVCAVGGFCAEPAEVDPNSNALPNAPGRDAGSSSGGSAGTASGGRTGSGGVSSNGGTSGAGGVDASLGGAGGSGGVQGSGGTSSTGGVSNTGGSGTGGGSGGSGPGDAASDAPVMVTLTVEDPLNWCTIQEDTGAPFSTTKSFVVEQGTVVDLNGGPASAVFVWGYWTGTDRAMSGDGATKDTNNVATVTMDRDKTVVACCALASNPTMPCQ